MINETIAAVASGMTASGIGIIRISGPEAFEIADKICRLRNGRSVKNERSHTVRYGYVVEPGGDGVRDDGPGDAAADRDGVSDNGPARGREIVIDEALFLLMRGPATYTREDTVEIDCHGGPAVMRQILKAVLKSGARAAEPGEFTKRAFLNGRIDLSEAEAVMDVINAKNEAAIKSAVKVLRGSVRREIEAMRSLLLTHLSRIEASIDDPEHLGLDEEADLFEDDSPALTYTENYLTPERMRADVYRDTLRRDAVSLTERLEALLARYDEGRYIREGIKTVIVGKPNAGKSSLLNLLSGEDRAIVTEMAGTTRDLLEETVTLGGLTLILTDTAGIRETDELVEKIGVERAQKAAAEADLILYVADASRPFDSDDEQILGMVRGKKAVVGLLNKTDLFAEDSAGLKKIQEELAERLNAPVLLFSATEGTGLKEFSDLLSELFASGHLTYNEEVTIASERQRQAVAEALSALRQVVKSLDDRMPEDFYAIDLTDAYASLGRVLGLEVGEDVISEVFARFCMGK